MITLIFDHAWSFKQYALWNWKKLAILLFVDSFDYWLPSPKYELCVGFETKDLSKLDQAEER